MVDFNSISELPIFPPDIKAASLCCTTRVVATASVFQNTGLGSDTSDTLSNTNSATNSDEPIVTMMSSLFGQASLTCSSTIAANTKVTYKASAALSCTATCGRPPIMLISFVPPTADNTAAAHNIQVNYPGTSQLGDVAVVVIAYTNPLTNYSLPVGWKLASYLSPTRVFYRVCDTAWEFNNINWRWTAYGSNVWSSLILRNVDTAILDAVDSYTPTYGGTFAADSVNTSFNGDWILSVVGKNSTVTGTDAQPSGWTKIGQANATTAHLTLAYYTQDMAGATNAGNWVMGTSAQYTTTTLSFKPLIGSLVYRNATTVLSVKSTVTADGTVTPGSGVTKNGSANLGGFSFITTTANVTHSSQAQLTNRASLASVAIRLVGARASLSSSSTMSDIANVTHAAASLVSGRATVIANGLATHKAQALLINSSTLVGASKVTHVAASTFVGKTTLLAGAIAVHNANTSLVATARITAVGSISRSASTNLIVRSNLTGSGLVVHRSQTGLAVRSIITASAIETRAAQSTIAIRSTLAASAVVTHGAYATLAVSSATTIKGTVAHKATGSFITNASLVSVGGKTYSGNAQLLANSSISSVGTNITNGSAFLKAVSSTSAQVINYVKASAFVVVNTMTTGVAINQIPGRASLANRSNLGAIGSVVHTTSASLTGRTTLLSTGSTTSVAPPLGRTFNYFLFDQGTFDGPLDGIPGEVRATAHLSCVSSIISDAATNLVPGSANLQSTSSLIVDSVVITGGSASLTCNSELVAFPIAIVAGSATLTCDSELAAVASSLLIVPGSASLFCISKIDAQLFNVYDEFGYGGVVVGGVAHAVNGYLETMQGGVVIGGVGGVGAVVTVNVFTSCKKAPLPHHPKPSIADYRPQTVAPLIEFFNPIVSEVLGSGVPLCGMVFRYENNTPCLPKDDIFVKHPTCIPVPYTPKPKPRQKSKEQLLYEQYAKKSQRLYNYMIASPARIKYFDGDAKHESMPY